MNWIAPGGYHVLSRMRYEQLMEGLVMRFTVKIEKLENGDCFIELPDEIVKELGVDVGNVIEWVDDKNGSWTLKKFKNADDNIAQSYSVESVLTQYPVLKSEIEDVFGEADLGIEWLTSPIPALAGLSPVAAVLKGDLKLVLQTLNRMRYGDFS